MENSGNSSFDIPPGFTLEEINGELYHEDLDEDDELWLIRMPSNIELSDLDRKKIFLSENAGDATIKDLKTENGKILECYSENCGIPSTCVVLPQKSNGKLSAVKKDFKGTILISEGLALDNDVEIKSENEQENNQDSVDESRKEKRKKKKRTAFDFDTSDLNYETDDAETVASRDSQKTRSKRHSKSHKKSTSESVEIKDEPMSVN